MDIARTEGAGLSAEKAETRDLMAVGYEDDSFIVYSILQGFKPLFRGLGHRGQREYRLISGGEDGLVMWWNLLYSPVKDSTDDDSMLRFVDVKQIQNIKPAHEIHLTVSA